MGNADMLEVTSHVYQMYMELARELGKCEILMEKEEEAKNERAATAG